MDGSARGAAGFAVFCLLRRDTGQGCGRQWSRWIVGQRLLCTGEDDRLRTIVFVGLHFHTAGAVSQTSNESPTWWQVDLGEQKEVRAVQIVNRADCVSSLLLRWARVPDC